MSTGQEPKLVKLWFFPTALPQKLIKNVVSVNQTDHALTITYQSGESGRLHTYGCSIHKLYNWEIEPDTGQNTRTRS